MEIGDWWTPKGVQEHWLAASVKMEPRRMLRGELLHPRWSRELAEEEAGWCAEEEVAGSATGSRPLMGLSRALLGR